jgi:regulator of protease activity HflC (stomatin/prohibitin superfamily)
MAATTGGCCCCCCLCVPESSVSIVESFGQYHHVAYPGISCFICCTQSIAGTLSLRVRQHKINVETRSKDNVFITVKMAVQFKVAENPEEFERYLGHTKPVEGEKKKKKKKRISQEDKEPEVVEERVQIKIDIGPTKNRDSQILYNAFYKLQNPVDQILAHLEEYFRFHGMSYTLDEIFAAKNDMTHELQQMLNSKMNPFGYIICNILVLDIEPDAKVKQAMNDIIASEKEKRAQQARAEADKITTILNAEAEAITREKAGEGIANARKAIIKGLQSSVETFQEALPGSQPADVLVTVLMTQYMDTIKEAASTGQNTFVLPASPGQMNSIEDSMRTALLTTFPPRK